MEIKMIVEKTTTGFSAYSEKLPVHTEGTSLDELKSNMIEALNLYFQNESKVISEEDLSVQFIL